MKWGFWASWSFDIEGLGNAKGIEPAVFSGPGGITPPGGNTGVAGSFVPGWTPDLRKYENRYTLAILVMM
jgi:hypothetical protein